MGITVRVNAGRTISAIDQLIKKLPDANHQGVDDMAKIGIRAIQTKLESGSPLRVRSGALAGSVEQTLDEFAGAVSRAHVAPTIVYARIQELGGISGKGHRSKLPPRPYVAPAEEENMDRFRDAAIDAVRGAF